MSEAWRAAATPSNPQLNPSQLPSVVSVIYFAIVTPVNIGYVQQRALVTQPCLGCS